MNQPDRETALLTLASRGGMKKLDVSDLEAIAELADDDGLDLATVLVRGMEIISRP